MAKIDVRIPKQCEDDEIVTIDTPIRPCCMQMITILLERRETIRYYEQADCCLLHIDTGYWIPMRYCPYCGKGIESADKKKRRNKKTYEEYDFIEYQPLKG